MLIRKMRLKRGWSQDHLAVLTGLSVRTIQRIEHGQKPSLESAKALASVFEVDIATFTEEENFINTQETISADEIEALRYAKRIKDFYEGIVIYVVLAVGFGIAFAVKAPHMFQNPVIYIAFGFAAFGPVWQGLIAFEIIRLPFQDLERKLAEKKLKRKL